MSNRKSNKPQDDQLDELDDPQYGKGIDEEPELEESENSDSELSEEEGVDLEDNDEEEDDEFGENEDRIEDDNEVDDEDQEFSESKVESKRKCVYKALDDSDSDDDVLDGIVTKKAQKVEYVTEPDKRISRPFLTKYEHRRIWAIRTAQLSQGAKPMIKGVKDLSERQVAKLELDKKVIPIMIHRPIPGVDADGIAKVEVWKIRELTNTFE